MILEPRTVVVLNAVGAMLLSVGLFVVARSYLHRMQGVTTWGYGNVAQALGWIALALRGVIPDAVSVIGTGAMLTLSLALYYQSLREFSGASTRRVLLYVPVAATAVLVGWYGLVHDDIARRTAIIAATAMLYTTMSAHQILFAKSREKVASHRFTGLAFLGCALVLAVRAVAFFAFPEAQGGTVFAPNALQDASFITFFVIVIGLTFGFVLMCTDRYNAEASRLAVVAQRMGAAVLVTDPAGRIEWVNPAFEALAARPMRDLVELLPGDVMPALRMGEPVGDAFDAAVARREPFESEFAHPMPGGATRWLHIQADPQHSRGTLERTIAVLSDVTERKSNELVLVAARDQAETAARAKSDFLAMMSHEIRTPMNGVLGMTSLLAGTPLSAEQADYVDATRRSAQLLLGVINDILDFSKVDAGKLVIEPIAFDVHAAVADVADLLAPRAKDKGLRLAVRIAPAAPRRVIGDAGRIRQVLLNLMGNAVKFTDQGFVSVVVEPAPAGKHGLHFEVNDSGIGIPAQTLETLFQPFVQADASTTRRFGGTGLGLSITKRLVELMGGEVGVRSEEGVGSTFWFDLPLPLDERPAPEPAPAASLHDVDALVVDDVEINLRVMTEWMRSWGMRVHTATDGAAALVRMREQQRAGRPLRLAVIDSLMPGLDGEKLGRAVRADADLRDIGLVLATSGPERGDAERFHKAGFDAYLTKPLRPDTFKGTLEIVLARPAGRQQDLPIVTRHVLLEGPSRPQHVPLLAATGEFESVPPALRPRMTGVTVPPREGARVRALLVEDNIVNQIVAAKILEHLGCAVDIGRDGVEALEMTSATRYDIVFMDMQMPRLDGLEATRRIRARGGDDATLRIVAMTANAMQGDRERCLDAGMDDYVSKPISKEDLARVLDELPQGA